MPRSMAAGRVPGEPYVQSTDDPHGTIRLVALAHARRPDQSLGPHFLAQRSLRFQAASARRLGFDWPISYEDVAPYYDKVERLIGVYGSSEGLENTPNSPEGCLLPPPAPLVSDYLVQQRARRVWAFPSSPVIARC